MDSRRLGQLRKSLSDKGHPWNKFGCGNKTTLLKEAEDDGEKETRRRVVDWWEKHYCASRMKVAIVGAGMSLTLVARAVID
jgi:insulysin